MKVLFIFLLILLMVIFFGVKRCSHEYIVENKKVYWKTWDEGFGIRKFRAWDADIETFKALPSLKPKGFAKDHNHVFWRAKLIEGAEPDSFRFIDGYFRDKNNIFVWDARGDGMIPLENADPDTYSILNRRWSRDHKYVFFRKESFIPRHIESFEPLIGIWARDDVTHYYGVREVEDEDPATFEIDETNSWFARDNRHLFWKGWLIEEIDVDTFVIDGRDSGHDGNFRYRFRQPNSEEGVSSRKIEIIRLPFEIE